MNTQSKTTKGIAGVLTAGSDAAFHRLHTVDRPVAPSMAPVNAVPGIMPEMHTTVMVDDQVVAIQTLDGAVRYFICLTGAKGGTYVTVYFTPDDEDGCEVFSRSNGMPRKTGDAKLYLGPGVLARLVEHDGRTLSTYLLPDELQADRWTTDPEVGGMHYAMDAEGRLAFGYFVKASGFQVVNGPRAFKAVKYQPAVGMSRGWNGAEGKGGKQ
jgi:hypothetical protein